MVRKLRIMIAMALLILFIMMMGYHMFDEVIHEWLGIVLFGTCFLHQLVNRRWFMTVAKGKYIYERKLFLCLNSLLILSFTITVISGILLSKSIFAHLELRNLTLARKLHMLGSVWTFLLMSMHAGLHLRLHKVKDLKDGRKYVVKILSICLLLYGCFVFYQRGLMQDMFAWNDFKFLPYGESFLSYVMDYVSIAFSGTIIGYVLLHKKDIFIHRFCK